MLRELELSALGVIRHARIDFPPGLTVITGETGAGKTMLLGALNWLAGGRTDAALVAGERAQVSGVFALPQDHPAAAQAIEAGGILEGDELVVSRTVNPAGRSRAHLGGVTVPSAALTASIGQLVAVHGQADQLRLRSARQQRDLLDRYGAISTSQYKQVYDAATTVLAQLASLDSQDSQAAWESDALRRALREIDAVNPQPAEEIELPARIERLANAEDLRQAAVSAGQALAGPEEAGPAQGGGLDPGAVTALDAARRALEAGAARDPALAAFAGRAGELAYLASDLANEVAQYCDTLESDPGLMAQLQERRAALGALLRKCGPTANDVLTWAETARQRLDELDFSPQRRQRLAAEAAAAVTERDQAAAALSEQRRQAAKRLAAAVTAELRGLGMAQAQFEVAVDQLAELGPAGGDAIDFRFTSHRGPLRPLARGASGGELSRVMLALEVAAIGQRTSPASQVDDLTLVFDEVDQGVGGAAALALAERLARLAQSHQVLAVTHLPQIAAAADHHVVVTKGPDGTSANAVEGSARRSELARMLAGLEDSVAAQQHADELLARDWVAQSSPE
ncbi:MAG: DNA repair protein RecN [Bifidobacteriaceae bacterium]|jgi:DNA repair protein RecN (Recombination protein N)|nr:DNA repair protein RecN [Bifidobacteriaceae bacterium]